MMRGVASRIVLAAALSIWVQPARAGVEETFGLNSRGISLGGAYTSLVCDTSAAYYNPAGLACFPRWYDDQDDRQDPGTVGFSIDIGAIYGTSRLSYEIGGAREEGGAPAAAGGVYGLSIDFERLPILGTAAIGIVVYMPYEDLFEYETQNITRPTWIRYSDGYNHLSLYPAIAFSPSKFFSVGFGFRFSLEIETHSDARYWDEEDCAPDKESWECAHIDMGEEVNIGSRFSFLAGIMVRPIENLKLAAVYRKGTYVDDWGDTKITNIINLFPYDYDHLLSHYYHPTQYEFGASWENDFWLAALTLSYNVWDEFIDTYRQPAVPGFHNTVTLRAGGGISIHSSSRLLFGYAYEPSPVPEQTMISNFLDCDRHILSVGNTTRLDELFGFASPGIELNLYFQMQILPERSHTKDERAIRRFYRERLASVEILDEDGNVIPDESLDQDDQTTLANAYTERALEPGERFSYSGFFYSFGLFLSFMF